MKVLNTTKEKNHLTKVIFDNETEVLLDNDIISIYCIHKEDEISKEKLEEIIFQSDYTRAKSRALWYLDRSFLTEKALFDKLKRAGFKEKPCQAVIERLKEVGLLDDERFAQSFAERCIESNISPRETVYKLISKGVKADLAKSIVEELSCDEEQQIKNLIERKYQNKLKGENGKEKVYAALIRKGFSFGAVKSTMKKYIEELEYYE